MEPVNNKQRSAWRNKRGGSCVSAKSLSSEKGSQSGASHSAGSIGRTSKFSSQLLEEAKAAEVQSGSIMRENGEINIQALQELQDTIHTVGGRLLRSPRIDTALEYRAAVQKMLQAVIPHIHKKEIITEKRLIQTHNGCDLKEYKFTIITKINKQLDNVLKLILGTQADQMNLMKALDEMKGLIVDLLR